MLIHCCEVSAVGRFEIVTVNKIKSVMPMKTKILYVDNDAGWCRLVGVFLKLAGFTVLTARDAGDAMAVALVEQPGAVILEANVAGKDGAELIGYLKANEPDMPVILYTGLENGDDAIKQLLDKGAVQSLRKGNLQELVKCVEGWLHKRQQDSQPDRQPLLCAGDWQVV
jgi:DNA-binding NtrC family response regulator